MELAEPFEMTQPAISNTSRCWKRQGSSFAVSTARVAHAGWQKPASRRWISGWQCCVKPWRKTTTGSTTFWPRWKPIKKETAMSKMTLKTEGDTHIVVTRHFAAAPEAVYRAHTDPNIVQKWLLGPEGWTMPVCISEARPGGKFRYSGATERVRDSTSRESIWNSSRIAGSCTSSACTCRIPHRTTTLKPILMPTAPARS